jgi:hypothetical protein
MIRRRDTGGEKDKRHFLVLQGREAGLDSLAEKLELMCNEIATNRSLLLSRIHLGPVHRDYYTLAYDIVKELRRFAQSKDLSDQVERLKAAEDFINKDEEKTGPEKLSDEQFARDLTETHLANVASGCIVVLFLQGFDRLRDSDGEELPTKKWLLYTWLKKHVRDVDAIVVVLTAEAGLKDLEFEPYVVYHDLLTLNQDTLKKWAIESKEYGFKWFTGEHAKMACEICNGNPEKFRKLLDYTRSVLEVGESLAQSRYQGTQQTPSGGSE